MEKELQDLISNVKTLVDAKNVSESQFKEIKDQLGGVNALTEENAQLKQQVQDLSDLVSTIETKQNTANVVSKQPKGEEAMKTIVKEWLHAGKHISLKDFAVNHTKSLNVDGSTAGGGFPEYQGTTADTISRQLGTQIHEAAREASTIFNELGRKTVSSTDYSELVLNAYPMVAGGKEQMGEFSGHNDNVGDNDTYPDIWDNTATQRYTRVHLAVGKQYAKPLISTEAINDPAINVYAHLQQLLAREQSYYWEYQCLFGNGSKDNIRGVLSGERLKIGTKGTDAGDSWNDTLPRYTPDGQIVRGRNVEHFQAVSSVIQDSNNTDVPLNPATKEHHAMIIDFLIDLEATLATQYLAGAKWYMNRRTRAALKKIRNADGDLILTSETQGGFSLLGYPVMIADFIPDIPETVQTDPRVATWLMFGDLGKAAAIADIDEHYLVDPYTVDGAVQIKSDIRKGDIMQANDAVIMCCMATPS